MQKLKVNHTPRDVKVLTDQLVDSVAPIAGMSDFAKTLLDDPDAPAVLTTLGFSTVGKSLVTSATSSDALTTLGVSTFGKSLIDDADASTALSTLGVSAFAKTLLDDASAAAARTTLDALSKTAYDNRKQYIWFNHIDNGNFDLWRYADTQTSSGFSSDDRWYNGHNGSTKTHSLQSFTTGQSAVPNNPTFFSRTVVTSVAGAGNYAFKRQSIEYVSTLAGKTATLTFYAKADANRSIAVDFCQFFGAGGSPSAAVTAIAAQKFNLTTSWQKFQAVVSIPAITGKTIGTNGVDSLDLTFWFDAGSTYATRTASLGQQSGTFDIAHVSLLEGDASDVADPFPVRRIMDEVAEASRWYQWHNSLLVSGYNAANGLVFLDFSFPVQMRGAPSVSFYSTTYSNASTLATNYNSSSTHIRLQAKITASGAGYADTGIELFSLLFGYNGS